MSAKTKGVVLGATGAVAYGLQALFTRYAMN